jgi:hypothetical protein
MIVAGRVMPEEPGVMPEEPGVMPPEADRQLRLRMRNACLLARSFYEAGFSVVVDEIIIGERYDHLVSDLAGLPFELVVLAPRAEVVWRERDAIRGKKTVLGERWATYLDGELRATMAGKGVWVDNSDQTPEQTVQEIVRRLDLDSTA